MNPLPNYPGAKGSDGVWQRLISLMPPHAVYVEPFLGSGAVLRAKRPAPLSIGLDQDPAVVAAWLPAATPGLTLAAALASAGDGLCIAQADFLNLVASPPAVLLDPRTLVYVDPPYLLETRTKPRIYACELLDRKSHGRLLGHLQELPCMVMISHYPCRFYDQALKRWRRIQYRCMTRGGARQECCWCNFPPPATLHDPRWVGDGIRERERIKRKSRRWQARFAAMSTAERQVVASALALVGREAMEAALL